MKFLLDESVDARLASFPAELGHDATVVGRGYPASIPDHEALAITYGEGRILLRDGRRLPDPIGADTAVRVRSRTGTEPVNLVETTQWAK